MPLTPTLSLRERECTRLTIMIDNSPAPEHESRCKFMSKPLKGRRRARGCVKYGGLTPTLNLILPGPFAPQIVRYQDAR